MTTVAHEQEMPTRNVFLRIVIGVLWLIPVHFLTSVIIGGIVGAIAGSSTGGYDAGYASGHAASVAFFQKYRLIVLVAEILLTAVLSFLGVLPGTGKHKKMKNR